MRKGIVILNTNSGTDYVFPPECGVMINVMVECKAQAPKLCILKGDANRYHIKIDELLEKNLVEMKKQLIGKLTSVLDGLLKKLARYDEGSFFSSLLSLAVSVGVRLKLHLFLFTLGLTSFKFSVYRNQLMNWDNLT
jgi:hypothetical protein